VFNSILFLVFILNLSSIINIKEFNIINIKFHILFSKRIIIIIIIIYTRIIRQSI